MFLRGAECPAGGLAVGPPIRTQGCLPHPPSFPELGPRLLGEIRDVFSLGSGYKGLNLTSQPQL